MKQTVKTKNFEAQAQVPRQSAVSELALRVIDNPHFSSARMRTADTCEYIEEMVRELTKTALQANQTFLAFLLGAAAQEARFQAGRIHLGK